MPPEDEEYSADEFSRIFQKIANTIDFIAHNEMELAAIKLSVEQVRVESDNDDIRVQAIEEKDGFIVARVTAPKTEDRGVLYQEVNSLIPEYEAKTQVIMMYQYFSGHKVKQLYAAIRNLRATNNYYWSAAVRGCKKLSDTTLSQQLPFRLILCWMPCFSG